jgi:hypothetical protein
MTIRGSGDWDYSSWNEGCRRVGWSVISFQVLKEVSQFVQVKWVKICSWGGGGVESEEVEAVCSFSFGWVAEDGLMVEGIRCRFDLRLCPCHLSPLWC